MNRPLRIGAILAVAGLCLLAIPLFFITTPSATYSIDARAVDDPREDATIVSLDEVTGSVRNEVRNAVRSTTPVDVGTDHPGVPGLVRYDGQVYSVAVIVADPGGGAGVAKLGLLGASILALFFSAIACTIGGWRRYAR